MVNFAQQIDETGTCHAAFTLTSLLIDIEPKRQKGRVKKLRVVNWIGGRLRESDIVEARLLGLLTKIIF